MPAEILYSFRFKEDFYRVPVDKEERALIAIVGERLKEGRKLCKFTIKMAAELLQIEPQRLNEIEQGFNVDAVPLKMLKKAADVYQVSVDFLFGLAGDDWESAPEVRAARDITTFLFEHRVEVFSKAAGQRLRQQRRLDKLAVQVNALRLALAEVHEAYDKFTELNPEFDDMRGGATLQNRMNRANEAAISAHLALIKCKAIPKPDVLPEA